MKAVKLQNEGKWSDALAAFQALPTNARDAATARIHMAECKKRLGRWVEAAQDLDTLANDSTLEPASREVAASDLSDLRNHIPKLSVRTSFASQGLAVSLDGKTVVVPAAVEIDPGDHSVVAHRGERLVFSQQVVAAEDKTIEIVIDAPEATSPPPSVAAKTTATHDTGKGDRPTSPVPFILFGVGALFTGGALLSYSRAVAADGELRDSCSRYCNDEYRDARTRWNTITVASGVAAALSVGGGVTLLLLRPAPEARSALVLQPRGDGVAFSVVGAF